MLYFFSILAAVITAVEFLGDYFSLQDPRELGELLTGRLLEEGELHAALAKTDAGEYIRGLTTPRLIHLLLGTTSAE